MIQFDEVTKRYPGDHCALDAVSFTIPDEQFVVLTGPSGAGKSTLLKLIPLIERPTGGRVLINGQDISALSQRAIPYLRRNMGLVLQETRLLPDRTVLDNILLPLRIAGVEPTEALKRAVTALERVGLPDKAKELPPGLSGGEQQRVAIARAVVNRPAILIADEPTAHLDHAYAADIARLFRSFNLAGVTVIISTHDESLFRPFGPMRLTLEKGKLTNATTPIHAEAAS